MATAGEYWNQFYESHSFAKGKGPDKFVERLVSRLSPGKLLEVGMGEGQNAVFLAQKGFKVKGIDVSEIAVQRAQQLAKDTGVELHADKADLDMFMMGLMEYDSIVMIDFKPTIKRYYSELVRALKQGGTLLVKSLMIDEMTEALGPDDAYRNYFFHSNELIHNLRDLRIIYYNEDVIDGKKTVELLALKPLDKDAAKYKLFDMQTESAKDGPSKQRELAEALFKKK